MGGFLAQARKLGLNWDKSLLPAPTKKAMGLTEMEEVLPVSANEFHAITDGKTMGRFWQEANGSWAVQYGNETAAYSERGAAQEHAFGRPPMQQSGPVVGAGFGFAEALGEAAEASWSAVARDGMIHAMKKDEEVAFAVLGSDGKPGQVQFLKNPDEADKEKARQAIMNWQDFQRPNQNGTVDAVDGIDEAVTALLG